MTLNFVTKFCFKKDILKAQWVDDLAMFEVVKKGKM